MAMVYVAIAAKSKGLNTDSAAMILRLEEIIVLFSGKAIIATNVIVKKESWILGFLSLGVFNPLFLVLDVVRPSVRFCLSFLFFSHELNFPFLKRVSPDLTEL